MSRKTFHLYKSHVVRGLQVKVRVSLGHHIAVPASLYQDLQHRETGPRAGFFVPDDLPLPAPIRCSPSSLHPQLKPPLKFKQDSHCCAAAPSSAPAPCSESLIDSTIGGLCCLFIADHRDEAELRYPRTRASRRFSSHKSRALRTLNAVRSERDRINI